MSGRLRWYPRAWAGSPAWFFVLAMAAATMTAMAMARPSPPTAAARDATAVPSAYRWRQVTAHGAFPESYNFPVHVAQGRMWALHPEGTWSSADGRRWRKEGLTSARRNVYESQYAFADGAAYAFGMNTGNYLDMRFRPTIRRSRDMQRWETLSGRSNFPPRIFYGLVSFQGKFWLAGGYGDGRYYHDVWNSSDGVRWQRVIASAPWSPRSSPMLVAFRDRLWLIGGGVIDGEKDSHPGSQHEIWSSADGIAWDRIGDGLPQHSGGTPIVFDDQLWLVGANRDGRFGRASLVTHDGIRWREEPAPWTPRGGVAAWVHDGKLWMTGGKYSVTANGEIRFIYSNDVWAMEKIAGAASRRR